MKKVLLFLFIIVFSFSVANANTGDKIGYVYSTDITTYINGKEVLSCNIGGKTAIPLELVTSRCTYDNDLRLLIVNDFNPSYIKETSGQNYSEPIGTVIANIYETDIAVCIYDKIIPSYNIGGITCVAIEDLALDNAFSDIGGKFIWNEEDRTINLEFIYETIPYSVLENYRLDIIDSDLNFSRNISDHNGVSVQFKNENLKDARRLLIPVYYNGQTQVGYVLKTPTKLYYLNANGKGYLKDSTKIIPYLNEDILNSIEPNVKKTGYSMGDIVDMHLEQWNGEITDRYTGDSYLFLRITQETVRGDNDLLLYIRDDGSYEYIHDLLPETYSTTRSITNFKINEATETATFSLRGANQKYMFDLKNCELIEL